ncbi:MAG: exo-alpha-sialidase [Planctomycetaceae bacterium]|nr:exo-alpha-sialidase [Planctomycetaceae bacterium]
MGRALSTRRRFLSATTATAATFWICRRSVADAPTAQILDARIITPDDEPYAGWPTLLRRHNGELWVVYSGGRESHVCPFGQVRCMTSRDDGTTWTWPRVLLDSSIDDRDAGITETAAGTLLVTTFTSLAYEPLLAKAEAADNWDAVRLARWQGVHQRLDAEERKRELGTWMLRSTDGGLTWSSRYDCLVDSPHGPTPLADGRILYVGKQLWRDNPRIGVAASSVDGVSWEWLAEIPTRDGDDPGQYHELHAIETASGRLVAQIRNHNSTSQHETLQTESEDGGRSWTAPHSIGVWGYPSHLLRLQDGRLLMTYGHRRAPIGNQARVSDDEGRTWSEPMLISDDATSTDLGYPSTAELADGSLLSIWYEKLADRPVSVLRQARWKLT